MGLIREWLLGLTAAALIAGAATALSPSGKPRRSTRLAAGFLIVAVMLRPVLNVDFSALPELLPASAPKIGTELEKKNEELMRDVIEKEAEAYISDKAEAMGLRLEADFTAEKGEKGWEFVSAEIVCDCESAQRRLLEERMAQELGVPPERQYWSRNG